MHQLWAPFLVWKYSKIDGDFKNGAENLEKVFCFLDNCVWIGWGTFYLLRRKYLSSAVNVLTNSSKISDITKRDVFQIYFPHTDKMIWLKCCRADLSSLWDRLACWLSNRVLKRGVLDIFLITFFAIRNFGNA